MVKLTAPEIRRRFELLECELGNVEAEGELYRPCGSVRNFTTSTMCVTCFAT